MVDRTKGKAPWGAYSAVLWRFYRSGDRNAEKEYGSVEEAASALKAMLNRMSHRRIYDVRITRRRNVLYLERTGVGR